MIGMPVLSVSYAQSPYTYASAAQRTAGRTAVRTAVPAAQPEQPVTPVSPVKKTPEVSSDTPLNHADLLRQLETDPAAARVRGQIQYIGQEEQAQPAGGALARPGDPQSGVTAGTYGPGGTAASPADGNQAALPGQMQTPRFGDPRIVDASGSAPEKPVGLPGQEETREPYETESAREVFEEGECQTCKNRKYQDGSDDPGVSFKTATHVAPEAAGSAVRGHEYEHVVREQAKAQREDRKVVSQSVTIHTAICPECGKVYTSGGTTRTVTAADSQPEPSKEEEQADGEQEKSGPTAA